MSNLMALIVIAALLILSVLQLVFPFDNILLSRSLTLAEIMALVMMLANGTFTDRKYFNFAYLLIGMTVVGAMFKILHWTGADQLLLFCPTALVIVYIIHFVTKPTKGILDILKLLTAISYPAIGIIVLMHWSENSPALRLSGAAIFWITFVWFLVEGIHKKRLFAKEN